MVTTRELTRTKKAASIYITKDTTKSTNHDKPTISSFVNVARKENEDISFVNKRRFEDLDEDVVIDKSSLPKTTKTITKSNSPLSQLKKDGKKIVRAIEKANQIKKQIDKLTKDYRMTLENEIYISLVQVFHSAYKTRPESQKLYLLEQSNLASIIFGEQHDANLKKIISKSRKYDSYLISQKLVD